MMHVILKYYKRPGCLDLWRPPAFNISQDHVAVMVFFSFEGGYTPAPTFLEVQPFRHGA